MPKTERIALHGMGTGGGKSKVKDEEKRPSQTIQGITKTKKPGEQGHRRVEWEAGFSLPPFSGLIEYHLLGAA
jgi:hypothetical protein